MMGFGRGGRGKLLMELLNQPVRKPGQPPSQPKVSALSANTAEYNLLMKLI